MGKDNRATIELRFADEEPITAWESFSLSQNYLDPLDKFTFSVANVLDVQREKYLEKLQKGEEVTLWANGNQQATAVIVTRSGTLDRQGGWRLQLDCESTLHAAYQGSADPYYSKNLKADTPLVDVVLDVLGPYGFTSIVSDTAADVSAVSGKSLVGRADPVVLDDAKLKDFQGPQQGSQSAYQWCAALFSRFGLVLRTDRTGQLLLGAPDFEQASAYVVEHDKRRIYGGDTMLPGIKWRDTNQNQFSHYVARGEAADKAGTTSSSPPIGGVKVPGYQVPSGTPFDTASYQELRAGRHNYRSTKHGYKPKFWMDKKARDQDRCHSFARVMAAARGQSGFEIECAVDGLVSKTGRLWTVDTIGRVVIGDIGLDENMYLLEVTKVADRDGGQMTRLKWVPRYSIDLRST